MVNCCHVDDFLHAGEEHLYSVMSKLRKRFSARKVEEKYFDSVGFKVIQDSGSIRITHSTVGWSAVCDCGISWSYSLTF